MQRLRQSGHATHNLQLNNVSVQQLERCAPAADYEFYGTLRAAACSAGYPMSSNEDKRISLPNVTREPLSRHHAQIDPPNTQRIE